MQEGPGSADRGKRPRSAGAEKDNGDMPSPAAPAAAPASLDFSTYMAVKSAKLRVQFDEQRAEKRRRAAALASSSSPTLTTSEIFEGVVIHVNGLTVPCALDLKEIMLRHGGRYEYRPMDPRITHTVASNLADTKAIAVAKAKDGCGSVFVRPEWVTASVAAGRRLDVAPFLLRPPGMNLPGQRRLFSSSAQEGADLSLARRDPDRGAAARRAAAATARGVWPAPAVQTAPAAAAPAVAPAPAPAIPAPAPSAASPHSSSASAAAALAAAKRARAACDLLRGPPKSTADRPGDSSAFVGGFYRASRLHFIGSWRTRFEALATRMQLEDDQQKGFSAEFGKYPVAAAFAPPPPVAASPAGGGRGGKKEGNSRSFVIHLDMDCFFASVSLSKTPAYRGHPLVVCHSSGEGAAAAAGRERREGGEATRARKAKRSTGGENGDENGDESEKEEEENLDDDDSDADADDDAFDQFAGGEVACPCYLARSRGVRAGMGVVAARRLCPGLVAVPYDFAAYERASEAMYRVLLRCGRRVQPLSVDEALVDASGMEGGAEAAANLAERLRRAVFEATGGCPASAGVAANPLLARLATRSAKPDGLRVLASAREADELLLSLPSCDALPGVGWASRARLEAAGLRTVADIRAAGRGALAAALAGVFANGNPRNDASTTTKHNSLNATVQALWDAAHGVDDRAVVPLQPRRSVGAECNWGVRFSEAAAGGRAEAAEFLLRLCEDLARRLRSAGALPGALTLKLKVRKPGAGLPRKVMGHGICDSLSRTAAVTTASGARGNADGGNGDGDGSDAALASRLAAVGRGLLQSLDPRPEDIRGMGLVASKLVPVGGAAKLASLGSSAPPGRSPSAEKRGKGGRRQTDLTALLVPRRPGENLFSSSASPSPGAAAKRSGGNSAAAATTPKKLPLQQQQQQQQQQQKTPPVPPCEGWTFDSDSSSSSSSDGDSGSDSESESESDGEGDGGEELAPLSSAAADALNDVVALSQVDASVFDALPPRLQRELLAGELQPLLPEKSSSRERRRRKKDEDERKKRKKKKGEKKSDKRHGRRRPRSGAAIVPLPRPEELDREVLDALPLALRWEIERALREEEQQREAAAKRAGSAPPAPPPQLRQARLDRSGFLSPPLLLPTSSSSAEKNKRKMALKNPGSASAPSRRPPLSRTATPSSPSPSAKRGRGGGKGGGGWTTPVSAAAVARRQRGPAGGEKASAGNEDDEEDDDFDDFGGHAVAAAVLTAAATAGEAAAPAFEIAADWASGALLAPERADAEGALRVARALLRASRGGAEDLDRCCSYAPASAAAAKSALLRIQEAAVECFGAPLLLETRGERLLRRKRKAAAVAEEEEKKEEKQKGASAAAVAAAPAAASLQH